MPKRDTVPGTRRAPCELCGGPREEFNRFPECWDCWELIKKGELKQLRHSQLELALFDDRGEA